jgi:hypothetical protein
MRRERLEEWFGLASARLRAHQNVPTARRTSLRDVVAQGANALVAFDVGRSGPAGTLAGGSGH